MIIIILIIIITIIIISIIVIIFIFIIIIIILIITFSYFLQVDDTFGGWKIFLYCHQVDKTAMRFFLEIFAVIVIFLICILGVTGNVLVVTAVFRNVNLRTLTNVLLVSLAVADIIICTLVMPLAAISDFVTAWSFGDFMCDVWIAVDVNVSTASTWHLCLISIDRYIAVSYPIWYSVNRKSSVIAWMMIGVIWSLSFMLSILTVVPIDGFKSYYFCVVNKDHSLAKLGTFVAFYIPGSLIIVLYVLLTRATLRLGRVHTEQRNINRKGKEMMTKSNGTRITETGKGRIEKPCGAKIPITEAGKGIWVEEPPTGTKTLIAETGAVRMGTPNGNDKCETSNDNVDTDRERTTTRKGPENGNSTESGNKNIGNENRKTEREDKITRRKRLMPAGVTRERKVVVVIAVVLTMFLVCWLPFALTLAIISVCESCPDSNGLFSFFQWLTWSNSALNPIIYTIFNKEFRSSIRKIVRGRCCMHTTGDW